MKAMRVRRTACLAAAVLGTGSISASAGCINGRIDTKFSLDVAGCATDALAAGATAGGGLLLNQAKGIASTLVNSYVPGLGSLLFGGGSGVDPFAADTQKILNAIQISENAIVGVVLEQFRLQDETEWQAIQKEASDYSDPNQYPTLQSKVSVLTNINDLRDRLDVVVQRFQDPDYDVWHLQEHVSAVQLSLMLAGEYYTVKVSGVDDVGKDPATVLADTTKAITAQWQSILQGPFGALPYIDNLTMGNFTKVSNSRYSSTSCGLQDIEPGSVSQGPTSGMEFIACKYTVLGTGDPNSNIQAKFEKTPFELSVFESPYIHSGLTVYASSREVLYAGAQVAAHRNGTVFANDSNVYLLGTDSSWYWEGHWWQLTDSGDGGDKMLAFHHSQNADEYFLAGYGSVRPTIDVWRSFVSWPPNLQAQGLDDDLSASLSTNVPAFEGEFAALSQAALAGTALGTLAEDRRWAENYVLVDGIDALNALYNTSSSDILQVPTSGDNYRHYLKDRVSPSMASDIETSNFAAKFVAVVN